MRGVGFNQRIYLTRLRNVVARASRFPARFVYAREVMTSGGGLVHHPRPQVDVLELKMHLNIFRRVVENLRQYVYSMLNLPVPGQYLRLRNLPDDERVVEGSSFEVERPCRANHVRRIR